MHATATISLPSMTELMAHLPMYRDYRSADRAADAERTFRYALGGILKDCGDRLLTIAEGKRHLLGAERSDTLDELVNRIGGILRRLDRQGSVRLVGDRRATIAELEEIDTRLILLAEDAASLVRRLEADVPAARWFEREAMRLACDLDTLGDMAEERNYLLGLGWESEFTWPGRRP